MPIDPVSTSAAFQFCFSASPAGSSRVWPSWPDCRPRPVEELAGRAVKAFIARAKAGAWRGPLPPPTRPGHLAPLWPQVRRPCAYASRAGLPAPGYYWLEPSSLRLASTPSAAARPAPPVLARLGNISGKPTPRAFTCAKHSTGGLTYAVRTLALLLPLCFRASAPLIRSGPHALRSSNSPGLLLNELHRRSAPDRRPAHEVGRLLRPRSKQPQQQERDEPEQFFRSRVPREAFLVGQFDG